MKKSLEELKSIQTENSRIDLSIKLNVCPICGKSLELNEILLLDIPFLEKKCSKCLFIKMI